MTNPQTSAVVQAAHSWHLVASFFCPGAPKPGGSKRGFYIAKIKRVVIVDDCKKSRGWKDTVSAFAADHWGNRPLLDVPLRVFVSFAMPRPKNHYRTGKHAGELRADAPRLHTSKPDATKLWRSTEDALTNIIWKDDALIASQQVDKLYADKPGASVTVWAWMADSAQPVPAVAEAGAPCS